MHTFGSAVLTLLHVFATAAYDGNFLALDVNDCFERVSIGKRLNSSDVSKTISTTNLKQCGNECERILCNAYSFGVNGNGNGTCLLGMELPKSKPYDDPEYDLFMKILQCRDRTMCFVKLVGGRRITDKHIQRTLPVESKGDCELFCQYEKEFHCEGYNFRYNVNLNSYSSCQLTAVPTEKLDLSLDFQSDLDYDFYEKNLNASPSCRYLEVNSLYGQKRVWGQEPGISNLWQDLNPTWNQRNDIGYGNDKVYYDRGVISTGAPVSDNGTPLSIKPNQIPFLYGDINPTISTADRLPVSANECFIKARTGHHLQRENIIKSTNAPSLYGCETICANEQAFICNIFSYRYSFTSSMDNCHLGDKMLRKLDIFQDLVPDRDCDVFVRNELSQPGCQPSRNWDTDCFERIRSGLTFELSIVKFSVQAENLHECELICLHVKHFTCRVFSFRRVSLIGKWSDNCYLTDYPVIEMDPNKHFVKDLDCDIYNRGSYGRGCELDKVLPSLEWPTIPRKDLTPTVLTTYRPDYGVPPPLAPSPSLYGPRYGPPSAHPLQFFPTEEPPIHQLPQYIPIRPPSTLSPPINSYPVTPTSFDTSTRPTGTYVPSLPPTTFFHIPGEYTPVLVKPLNRDSVQEGVFKDLFDPYGLNPTTGPPLYATGKKLCYINFGNTARLLPLAIKKAMTVESEYQCKMECNKARESQHFRCSTLSYFGGYCEMSEIEMRDLKPNQDFSTDQRFLLYSWDFNNVHCLTPTAKFPPVNSFPGGLEWTWMRFTVNGQPCRSGSYCTQNANMDIWSCPVDQGDWDYCCRPDHKCGYSEGINYPWCYVGKSNEQWRPCSDQYFPLTNGAPQSWPVTYIHHTGPPALPPTGAPPSFSTPPTFDTPSTSSGLPSTYRPDNSQNNDTNPEIKHQQSLVDQFLSVFRSSSSSVSSTALPNVSGDKSAGSLNTAASTDYKYNNDGVPGFRVVDVTDKPLTTIGRSESAARLFTYDAINNRLGNGFTKRKPYFYVT